MIEPRGTPQISLFIFYFFQFFPFLKFAYYAHDVNY